MRQHDSDAVALVTLDICINCPMGGTPAAAVSELVHMQRVLEHECTQRTGRKPTNSKTS